MTKKSFSDFGLVKPLVKAAAAEQYHTATPIQEAAIPKIMMGRDILGVAQTGTGKTAAFAFPILHRISKEKRPMNSKTPRVLVLSPTRELATQISERFMAYGKKMNLSLITVFGGVNQNPQVRALRKGVHVLVATPGRLIDLLNQGHVELDRLEFFVLDEADRMLDMGFLKRIVKVLPPKRQSLFFSATMPPEAVELADELLHKPVRIDVTPDKPGISTSDLVEQKVMHVEYQKKISLLSHILIRRPVGRVLVFTRTKHGADRVAKDLKKRDIPAEAIHGDKSQNARTRILKEFKKGTILVLIATDLASRGIDVDGISHVINYDMPQDCDGYVHRIGRTGRAGQKGIAFTFCMAEDIDQLRAIEQHIQRKLEVDSEHPYHVPGLEELTESPPQKHRRKDDN
ncbi:MAG: DEAD/DEAH box helicase [Planctomycetota bacterium]|nr:DEAD/DEAH box helicase [Planctomycetota bacterium]